MIAVIDSGGANLASVLFALERLSNDMEALDIKLTTDAREIRDAERVILPGVGTAREVMRRLQALDLVDTIKALKQPVLGICVGMQILFEKSEEGNTDMLGLIEGEVRHFKPEPEKTIPHTGWNNLKDRQDHPLLEGLDDNSYFYFVHSFAAQPVYETIGAACHGTEDFSAIVAKGNFMGCQFHPERSGKDGARMLHNFARLKP